MDWPGHQTDIGQTPSCHFVKGTHDPLPGALGQFAVAVKFIDFMLVAWQHANDGFALGAQLGNRRLKRSTCTPGSTNGRFQRTRCQHADQFLQVKAESGGWPVTPEHGADLIVAAAACQLGTLAIDGEAGAAVVGIAAQISQVKTDLDAAVLTLDAGRQPLQIL